MVVTWRIVAFLRGVSTIDLNIYEYFCSNLTLLNRPYTLSSVWLGFEPMTY